MTRRVVEQLCTKKVCVDFLAPKNASDRLSLSQSKIRGSNFEIKYVHICPCQTLSVLLGRPDLQVLKAFIL